MRKARSEEMGFVRDVGVCVEVQIKKCWGKSRKMPIGIRWVYVNRGDDPNLDLRAQFSCKRKEARLVCGYVAFGAKKFLLAVVVTKGWGWNLGREV